MADSLDSGSSVHHARAGSSPASRTTSEQALYRLLRLFSKVRARSFRCSSSPTAIRFAGFTVGYGCRAESLCLKSVHAFQPVASVISLATNFYASNQKRILRSFHCSSCLTRNDASLSVTEFGPELPGASHWSSRGHPFTHFCKKRILRLRTLSEYAIL